MSRDTIFDTRQPMYKVMTENEINHNGVHAVETILGTFDTYEEAEQFAATYSVDYVKAPHFIDTEIWIRKVWVTREAL